MFECLGRLRLPHYINVLADHCVCKQARDTTKKMFYTDDDGETIPATDDDDEDAPQPVARVEAFFGRHQARDEWLLATLFQQFAFHPQALLALVTAFKWQWSWLVAYIAGSPRLLELLYRQRMQDLQIKKQGQLRGVAAIQGLFADRCFGCK